MLWLEVSKTDNDSGVIGGYFFGCSGRIWLVLYEILYIFLYQDVLGFYVLIKSLKRAGLLLFSYFCIAIVRIPYLVPLVSNISIWTVV